jgi:hypothetical protein
MYKRSLACVLLCVSAIFAQGPGAAFAGRPGGGMPGPNIVGRGGRGGMGMGMGAARAVTGAPFSAVEVNTFDEQLANGNAISKTSQTVLYRDSQGRTRTEVTITPAASTGKQPFTLITISDPVAGLRYLLDSSTMTSRSSRMPVLRTGMAGNGRGGVQARTGRGGAAVTSADLGTQLKNGVLATGSRVTEVIPAGRIGNAQPITVVRDTWFSAELKRAVEVKITDPVRGNRTMELTNLVPGEPSAAFFSVPAGYTESKAGRGGGRGALMPGGRRGQ